MDLELVSAIIGLLLTSLFIFSYIIPQISFLAPVSKFATPISAMIAGWGIYNEGLASSAQISVLLAAGALAFIIPQRGNSKDTALFFVILWLIMCIFVFYDGIVDFFTQIIIPWIPAIFGTFISLVVIFLIVWYIFLWIFSYLGMIGRII